MSEKKFEDLGHDAEPSAMGELWSFIVENKVWWMLPIAIVLALVGVLAVLGSSGAGPFVYTFF